MSSEVETSLSVSVGSKLGPAEISRDFSTSVGMTESLFTSLDVYPDEPTRSAAMNMAIDEALLETATVPVIRFYQWDHPALSFGYFGKYDDVARHDRDIVRRWTGGGIVFHDEDLTYSVVIPASDPAFGQSSMAIYENVHAAICRVLQQNGEPTKLALVAVVSDRRCQEDATIRDRRYSKDACFANPVRADVLLNGRKIAGAAQRRSRRGLLQQGSIQNVDLGNGFADSFAKALCPGSRPQKLEAVLVKRAEEIAAQRYGTSAWLRRR